MIDTNLTGALLINREACRLLLRAPNACIVNISSVVASTGNTGQVVYAASKAGLSGMTKSLARELGSRGIRVNCVEPGFVEGGMTDELTNAQKAE